MLYVDVQLYLLHSADRCATPKTAYVRTCWLLVSLLRGKRKADTTYLPDLVFTKHHPLKERIAYKTFETAPCVVPNYYINYNHSCLSRVGFKYNNYIIP